MVFTQTEIVYYAAVLLFGCLGGLARLLRDQSYPSFAGSVGSILASGIISFGVLGLWIGRSPESVAGPFYYLAVATFVGYFAAEITDYLKSIIKSIIRGILKAFGYSIENESNS